MLPTSYCHQSSATCWHRFAPFVATAAPCTGIDCEIEGAGVVVPSQDLAAFAWGIDQLLRHFGLRDKLGQGGRERALLHWSKDAIVDRFEAQMQLLLG